VFAKLLDAEPVWSDGSRAWLQPARSWPLSLLFRSPYHRQSRKPSYRHRHRPL